jgi:hypothetical protein
MEKKDGRWGGNVEVVVASRVYRRDIIVFSREYSNGVLSISWRRDDEMDDDVGVGGTCGATTVGRRPPLMLSYHGNDHYNSVRSVVVEDDDDGDGGTAPSSSKKGANVSDTDERRMCDGGCDRGTATSAAANGRPPARGSTCPCGSGRKYKKCCSARDKIEGRSRRRGRRHKVAADAGERAREEDDGNARRRGTAEEDEEEEDDEEETEKGGRSTGGGGKFIGSFKVLAI